MKYKGKEYIEKKALRYAVNYYLVPLMDLPVNRENIHAFCLECELVVGDSLKNYKKRRRRKGDIVIFEYLNALSKIKTPKRLIHICELS